MPGRHHAANKTMTSRPKPCAALFYGAGPSFVWAWGGVITSFGMKRLANALIAKGCDARCFDFNEEARAGKWLRECRQLGHTTLGYSYSLGNTTLTYLQSVMPFNLVFCIAMSELAGANNRPIVRRNIGRACLARGPGVLSDAIVRGFDEVRMYAKPHLLMDLDSDVARWALQEADAYL
jgi:hypothetical protein